MADAGSTFVVKFECGDDRRRVRLGELTYEVLQEAASEAYADLQEMPSFDLKYRDEDGDFCTLTPSTFVDFLDVTGSQATKLLRLTPRCAAASVPMTPRDAPPPCAILDAASSFQEGTESVDASDAFDFNKCLESAEAAQEDKTLKPEALLHDDGASSDSSSSSSESSYASSCTRRLEEAKQACLAAKQAWKEAKLHYKNEVKAVRQSLKQAKKEWKREQKEKIKATKGGGQRFGGTHEDVELMPLVAADWPAEELDEVEEESTSRSRVATLESLREAEDIPKQHQQFADNHQPIAEEHWPIDEKHQPNAEDKGQPDGPPPQHDKDGKDKSNLEILKEMGFEDMELNAQLLTANNDDVAAVLNILFGG